MTQSTNPPDSNNDDLPNDQQEDESDLIGKKISYQDTVSMTVDWTIETINSQVSKGNIELDPAFQRRAAWDDERKSRLIESLIVGMPIPNIVLVESKKRRGQYIVIDGKQRILSIRDFMENKLKLSGLDTRPDLTGLSFLGLPEDDRRVLENSTFRATIIKNWSDDKFLYAIFFRLNSGSLPLSPQELRRALVGGSLLEEIEEYIKKSAAFHKVIADKIDRRMRDSELVLRFIAFDRSLLSYNGDLREFLDQTARYFESSWITKKSEALTAFQRLDLALETTYTLFGSSSFKKWSNGKYERVINRAVFDSITRFFADDEVAKRAIPKEADVVAAFQSLSSEADYRASIERTTKSVDATRLRIRLWGERLAPIVGMIYDDTTLRLK